MQSMNHLVIITLLLYITPLQSLYVLFTLSKFSKAYLITRVPLTIILCSSLLLTLEFCSLFRFSS